MLLLLLLRGRMGLEQGVQGGRLAGWWLLKKKKKKIFLETFNVDEGETYCDKCASGFLTAEPGLDSDERQIRFRGLKGSS